MLTKPKVCILILNWNNWKDTIECLNSLLIMTYTNYCIILIDNGSSDNSIDNIKEWADSAGYSIKDDTIIDSDRINRLIIMEHILKNKIYFLTTQVNYGYAGGNNIGMKYALKMHADYLWLLNNDTIIDKNTLNEMISLIESDQTIGMVGSKVFYYDQPTIIQAAGGGHFSFWKGLSCHDGLRQLDDGQWDHVFEPDYLTGASLLVRNEVINSIGFMDETFFLYGEELEWQIRAKNRGWKLLYCPTSILWHKESASLSNRKPLIDFYTTRNWLRIVKRYKGYALPTAVCFQILRAMRRLAYCKPQQAYAVIKGLWFGLIS